jgi:ketosteroid isomerase-like protein
MSLEPASQSAATSCQLVRQTLDRFWAGWEDLDADRVLETLVKGPGTVMYGTDLAERWIGYDAIVGPVRAQVATFEQPRYTWGEGEPRIEVRGDVAWASGDVTIHLVVDDEAQQGTMRSTFVLVHQAGGWKIVQGHFSIGMETPVVPY